MKRILAIVLAALMLLSVLTGCSLFVDPEKKGAYINLYLGSELRVWDPALAMTDTDAIQYLSLVYEGIMKYDSKGKVVNALCQDYEIDEEANTMTIVLRKTAWSDGRRVSADDFIYSWKRILDPDFTSPAKSLLYYIKGARSAADGEITVDDVGLASVDTYTIEITFEDNVNYDLFLENLASISLAPVREDYVTLYSTWYSTSTNIICNGPFNVKNMVKDAEGGTLVLERNRYYDCVDYDVLYEDMAKDKYVKPFRLIINFGLSEEDRVAAFNYRAKDGETALASGVVLKEGADQMHYITGIASSSELASKAKSNDTLSTASLFLNMQNELLAKAEVRQALSLVLDREALASVYVGTKPATGLVPYGVYYNKVGSSYRDKAGDILASTAKADEAKALLASAGVNSGSFTLTYRETSHNTEIAEALKAAWETLGFRVTLNGLEDLYYKRAVQIVVEGETYAEDVTTAEPDLTAEDTTVAEETTAKNVNKVKKEIFKTGEQPKSYYNYDILMLDYQTLTTNAFSTLAPFAVGFTGNGVDSVYNDFEARTHATGYNSTAYNELIEKAFAANDHQAMADVLIEAEKVLLTDLPVIPLFFNGESYVASSALSGETKTDIYGSHIFTKVGQSHLDDYTTVDEEMLTTPAKD